MLIQSMTWQASVELSARAKVGRLACAHEGQPYITPMSLTYEAGWLSSFSTVGQKITWMRANPLVCVETEELVDGQNWATAIALWLGYTCRRNPARSQIPSDARLQLLQRRPMWWEPGYAKTVIDGKERSLESVYFRIQAFPRSPGTRAVTDTDPRAGG